MNRVKRTAQRRALRMDINVMKLKVPARHVHKRKAITDRLDAGSNEYTARGRMFRWMLDVWLTHKPYHILTGKAKIEARLAQK